MATDLDHIALAAADTTPLLHLLTGRFGGTTLEGGEAIGFRPMQVLVGTADRGMKIELLEPWETAQNDFLVRFLAARGAGPHHLTFKVNDLDVALERARDLGYEPININRSDPRWQEAFLHPKQSHGTVVQLAQSSGYWESRAEMLAWIAENGVGGAPKWWAEPLPAEGPPLSLERVVLVAPDLTEPRAMYEQLLEGSCVTATADACELEWPGGGVVRLELQPGGAARIDRLEVEGLRDTVTVLGTTFTPAQSDAPG